MKKDIDFLLNLAADSSKEIKDDKLAKVLSEYDEDELSEDELSEDELSEDELDEVYAAAKPDIENLMRKLKDDGKNG